MGHQVIYAAFGGEIIRAAQPIHGRSLPVDITDCRLLSGIASGSQFARYHSLIADPRQVPTCLEVVARSQSGEIMALAHREHATFGVQFHPESVLSNDGYQLLANFLDIAGLARPAELPEADLHVSAMPADDWREQVVEHAVVLPRQSPLPTELMR